MEAPKIEVTDMNPAEEPHLFPELCEVDSGQWPELVHDSRDFLMERPLQQVPGPGGESQDEARGPQRRSSCRRRERGPGKSPSPSRHSPRRYSPVHYSPKRQHRACSPVTFNDCYDVTLSPRHHSPVPRLVDGSRAQSLTSDDLICVSYSDPFSATVYASEGGRGLSAEHSDQGSGHLGEMDHSNTGLMPDLKGTSWLATTCPSAEDGCLQETLTLLEEGDRDDSSDTIDHVVQDRDLFLYEADEQQTPSENRRCLTLTDNGHCLTSDLFDTKVDGQNLAAMRLRGISAESSGWNTDSCAQAAALGDGGCVADTADICADSSSEEDMEDDVMTFQNGVVSAAGAATCLRDTRDLSTGPGLHPTVPTSLSASDRPILSAVKHTATADSDSTSPPVPETSGNHVYPDTGHCQDSRPTVCGDTGRVCFAEDLEPDLLCSLPEQRVLEELTLDDPSWCCPEKEQNVDDSVSTSAACPAMEPELCFGAGGNESKERASPGVLRQCSNRCRNSGEVVSSDLTSLPPSPPQSDPHFSCGGPPQKASPGTTRYSPSVGKTPQDFTLARLVGCPPLQFQQCHNMVLIHRALSNPYNPDLPTPPIVLTFHDSHHDPGMGSALAWEAPVAGQTSPGVFSSSSQGQVTQGCCFPKGDIFKSTSCPNLHHTDANPRPHQAWPDGLGHSGVQDNDMNAFTGQGFSYTSRDGVGGAGRHPAALSPQGDMDSAACSGPPTSPCSSRAAVIGRLRMVVERRLSASLDSLQADLHQP